MTDELLHAIGERIEGLTARPHDVRAPLLRLARPLLRALGYRPALRTERVSALLEGLRAPTKKEPLEALVEGAEQELEDNVRALEKTLVVHGRIPLAHAAWVRRLYEVTVRAARAARDRKNEASRRIAAAIDPVRIAPPLAISPRAPVARPNEASDKPKPDENTPESFFDKPLAPEEERLVEVELLAIDHLLDAARGETEFLERKRRLLEAARKLLLDASAALPLAKEGVEVRRRHLAMEIARVDRLEAAGLSPRKGLLHQAKDALARGERQRLHAALVALDGASLAAGDEAMLAATTGAKRKLGITDGEERERDKLRSLRRSSVEMFGDAAMAAIAEGYVDARRSQSKRPKDESAEDKKYRLLALQWLAPQNEVETHAALCSIDGAIDVGIPLAPLRVVETETRVRLVRHPTEDLILTPARDVADLPHAIIEDPRTVLLALAEGRLLARRYVAHEVEKRKRTRLVGEARVYVLDGSSSMLEDGKKGTRARVRDAILLAELGMLVKRFAEGDGSTRITLHYRYFTKKIGPIVRVADGRGALAAMAEVAGTVRKGGTDIENALLSSFEAIRKAKDDDPDLARAQIVLVTDGDAEVSEEAVEAARAKVGDVPIAVSVVALGLENEALRGIVARQRSRGERAFYHHLDDDALVEICEGKLLAGTPIHVEDRLSEKNLSIEARAALLRAELGGLVDELDALSTARSAAALEALVAEADAATERARAEAELGVAPDDAARGEGRKALREAVERDRRALERRFLRWFPAPSPAGKAPEAAGRTSDAEAVVVVISTIAEVVGDFGGSDLSRRAEAIDLLERLLPDSMLTPARWFAVLRDEAATIAPAMRALHHAVTAPQA